MASSVKKKNMFCIEWTNNLWAMAVFMREKKGCFVALWPLELDVQPYILLVFFCKWTQTHAWLIDPCHILLPPSVHALFGNWWCPWNKGFQEIHSCLSPVEIPDLLRSKNPSMPSKFHLYVSPLLMPLDFQFKECPLPSEFQKPICRMVWIFSGIAQRIILRQHFVHAWLDVVSHLIIKQEY